MNIRYPVVAGLFYPDDPEKLKVFVAKACEASRKKSCYSLISPHAGYVYSGEVAGKTIATVSWENIDYCVILGPNHTGLGKSVAVSLADWLTPLGPVANAKEISKAIINSEIAEGDELAHAREHSIEVQLPFIQHLAPHIEITPICMLDQSIERAKGLARILHEILPKNAVVLASSDFSHYVPDAVAKREDEKALEKICALELKGFEQERRARGWSICGYGPIMVAMEFAKLRGAKKGEVVCYATSAKTNGIYSEVVGYAGVVFPKV